jgi:hypothetical protein
LKTLLTTPAGRGSCGDRPPHQGFTFSAIAILSRKFTTKAVEGAVYDRSHLVDSGKTGAHRAPLQKTTTRRTVQSSLRQRRSL